MYRIDRQTNSVTNIGEKKFKELKIREREHLQEWIAKNPEMLDEELLIIQKEFDGFHDTGERLDLLAIDKSGALVVIENKLDDTGRNVVWQALKYVSYCSTLTTKQIIKIFQKYLDNNRIDNEGAEAVLRDHLNLNDDEDELLLNSVDQRIIFVANDYRKEVTSTVMWLLNHDINIQCFRVMPFKVDDIELLQVEQIIPLPETEAFIIEMKEKEKEEREKSKAARETEDILNRFWIELKKSFDSEILKNFANVQHRGVYSFGMSTYGGQFNFCIGRRAYRVELYMGNDKDKALFEKLSELKNRVHSRFNLGEIDWERLGGKNASRIKFEMPDSKKQELDGGFRNEKNWPAIIEWYGQAMEKFYKAVFPVWEEVKQGR